MTNQITTEYQAKYNTFNSLLEEFLFVIRRIEEDEGVKIHSIESRIKSVESISSKIAKNNLQSINQIDDIAGIRIICLFKGDLDRIRRFLESNFRVISKDEKIFEAETPFQYLSNHYLCKFPDEFQGPRYNLLKEIPVEIQTRTLCMHSWAAVSHYLDYKSEIKLDDDQKLELQAIAGLFFVADQDFERFYQSRIRTSEKEHANTSRTGNRLNFDEFSSFMRFRFHNRKAANSEARRALFAEILQAEYNNLDEVKGDVDQGEQGMRLYEKDKQMTGSLKGRFADVGATRIALRISNIKMRQQSNMAEAYQPYLATTDQS